MTAFWRAKIAEQRRERCALQLYFYQQKTTHRRPPDYGPQRSTSSTLPRQRALFFLSPSSTFADVSHTAQNSNTRCCYMKRTNEREKAKANEKYKCRHLAIWNGMSTLRTRNEKRTNISAQCGKKRKKYKNFCASRSGLLSALGVFYGAQAACFSTTYGNFYSIIFTGGASLRSPPFARCCWALCSFEKKNVSTWKTEIYILFFIMKNIAEWIFINTLAFFCFVVCLLVLHCCLWELQLWRCFFLRLLVVLSLSSRPIARLKDPTDSFQLVVVFIVVYTMAGQAAFAEE